MAAILRVLLVLGGLGLVVGPIQSQTGDGASNVRLDLPKSDEVPDDDVEDDVEIITFYDSQYEGEAFFFCCDHSSSMNHSLGGRPKLQVLKEELIRAINQMSADAEFSIVFFDATVTVFSDRPVRADPAGKARGIAWVASVPPGRGTCLAPAGVKTLQIANFSTKRYRAVVILTDGMPWCGGTLTTQESLSDITGANVQRIPIHTIAVPDPDQGEWDPDFLRQLASLNGGTFRMVGQ